MNTYEQKLAEFAEGKKFQRLARPIRDRADGVCDACGSPQPRTLHVLKDEHSSRYYMVGHSCLSQLARRGALVRRYGKESAHEACKLEMEQRATAQNSDTDTVLSQLVSAPNNNSESDSLTARITPKPEGNSSDSDLLCPTVLLFEAPDYYEAIVLILSGNGVLRGRGHSRETRGDEVWEIGGESGLVLTKVKRTRPNAMSMCLSAAWQEAYAQLGVDSLSIQSANDSQSQHWTRNLISPGPLLSTSVAVHKIAMATAATLVNGSQGNGNESSV